MSLLAELAMAALVLNAAPQGNGADPEYPTALSKAEHKTLNRLAKKLFDAEMKLDSAEGRRRTAARKSRDKAKSSWDKEWEKRAKKDPLKHVGDLQQVFANVFPYAKQRAYGEMKPSKGRFRKIPYGLLAPRGYKADKAYRAVICLPDRVGDKWAKPKEHYAAAWGKPLGKNAPLSAETVFIVPEIPDEMEMDAAPDRSSENDMKLEAERRAVLLDPAGTAQFDYRFDRNRVFLDCGKGNCQFGLRLATYFPARFAGLILRDAKAPPADFRVGSLAGLAILLVQNADNADGCKKLKARLDAAQPGSCVIIEASKIDEIAKWVQGVKRNLFRKKITIEPTDDRYTRAYWVDITQAEPIDSVAVADRPRLVVEADRDANRISITAKSVTSFRIMLNDTLVDLDKEFSIVVNGKAINETRVRSLTKMLNLMRQKFDSSYLFPADYQITVPKADADTNGGGAPEKPKKPK